MNKRLDEIATRVKAATTVDKLKPIADAYAQEWIVHAIDRLVANMNNPDDVASSFEIAFADGYMTGLMHSSAEKDLTLLLEIVRTQDVENANLRAALVHAQCAIKDLGASVNEMYPSDLDGWADVLLAEIEKLERGGE